MTRTTRPLKVACLGGGHGLSATLRAVRTFTPDVTAVVSVADDGGSSGRLRSELGILPPGDLRRCVGALADPNSALGQALEHRFGGDELREHALGNLLLAGLIGSGLSVEAALREIVSLVNGVGTVLPVSTEAVTLTGRVAGGAELEGQVQVQDAVGVRRIGMRPADPAVPAAVPEVIKAADLVVLGPGSLFTSVLAAALVPGVAAALASSDATKVLVMNLGPQRGEAEGLDPNAHRHIVEYHDVRFDLVLADPRFAPDDAPDVRVRQLGVVDRALHDPVRLGAALGEIAEERSL